MMPELCDIYVYACKLLQLLAVISFLPQFSLIQIPSISFPLSKSHLPVLARSQMFHRLRNIGKQWYTETLVWGKQKHTLRGRTTVLS